MSYFEDGDCPAYEEHLKNNRFIFRVITLFALLFTLIIFMSLSVHAFQIKKELVQVEVDPNYPCSISGNKIICEAITVEEVTTWKNEVNDTNESESGFGSFSKSEVITRLEIPSVPREENINGLTQEYTLTPTNANEIEFDINTMDLGDRIKVGFASNVFVVKGAPVERFIINNTNGTVEYAPYNDTKVYLNGTRFYNGSENTGQVEDISFPEIESVYFNSTTSYTLSIWANRTIENIVSNSMPILTIGQYDESTGFVYNIGDRIYFGIRNLSNHIDEIPSTSDVIEGKWYHILGMYNADTGNMSFYVDGEFIDTEYANSSFNLRNQDLRIGSSVYAGNSHSFNGELDELRIYNVSLTESQVLEINNSGRLRNDSLPSDGLILWNSFNTGFDDLVADNVAEGNDAFFNQGTPEWRNDGVLINGFDYDVNITIQNMSNSLVFWDNGTLLNSSQDGEDTFTFSTAQLLYILDDHNLTEGQSYLNSPVAIVSTTSFLSEGFDTKTYTINNSIDEIDGLIFVANTKCPQQGDTVQLTSHSGIVTTPTYNCLDANTVEFTLNNIETSSASNSLLITYNKQPQAGGGGSTTTETTTQNDTQTTEQPSCELGIGNIGAFNLDTSLPIPKIYSSFNNCEDLQNIKYVLEIGTAGDLYFYKGIKIYIPLLIVSLYLLGYYLQGNRRKK